MMSRPQTVDEWMERLESKSLKFLQDQTSPHVCGYNGKAYGTAVIKIINKRMAAGETVECHRPMYVAQQVVEEDGEVEIISYGGKGGVLRIVHQKEW